MVAATDWKRQFNKIDGFSDCAWAVGHPNLGAIRMVNFSIRASILGTAKMNLSGEMHH
jgi:hypothetical protein